MADEAVAEVVEEVDDIDEEVVNEVLDEADAEPDETETTDSEETAKDEPEPSESSPEKKDDGFQKRIDELTTRYYNEKQQADFYKQQYEEATKVAETFVEPGKTLADFEYDEGQYASYLQEQAKAEARADVERAAQQERIMQRRAEFEMKEAQFATNLADYQVVTRNPALPITEAIVETLQSAEKGPEVLYYLGKHPEIAASLAGMAPLDAAREIGRIEATKLVKPEPSITKAPAPPPKIKASDTGETRIKPDSPASDDKLSDREWLRRRQKQLEGK